MGTPVPLDDTLPPDLATMKRSAETCLRAAYVLANTAQMISAHRVALEPEVCQTVAHLVGRTLEAGFEADQVLDASKLVGPHAAARAAGLSRPNIFKLVLAIAMNAAGAAVKAAYPRLRYREPGNSREPEALPELGEEDYACVIKALVEFPRFDPNYLDSQIEAAVALEVNARSILSNSVAPATREQPELVPKQPYTFEPPNLFRWREMEPIELTPTLRRLLEYMFEHPAAEVTVVADEVWGALATSDRAIKSAVHKLNKQLTSGDIPVELNRRDRYLTLTIFE